MTTFFKNYGVCTLFLRLFTKDRVKEFLQKHQQHKGLNDQTCKNFGLALKHRKKTEENVLVIMGSQKRITF